MTTSRLGRRVRRKLRTLVSSSQNLIPLFFLAFLSVLVAYLGLQLFLGGVGLNHQIARAILSWGMPRASEFAEAAGYSDPVRSFVYLLTDLDLANPVSMVEGSVSRVIRGERAEYRWPERPFVFVQELSFAPDPVKPPPETPRASETNVPPSPRILLYHSHNSEMYLGRPVQGHYDREAHYAFKSQTDSTITGIMEVGRHLANALERLGIAVFHETRIHDLPTLDYAYANSEKTVRNLLNQYESIEVVLDLHRDANVSDATVEVAGRKVARLLIVVGTAESIPLVHRNYESNLAFAERLYQTANRMYPGLMRPTQVRRDARYNQHLHPNSLLIEIGSVENTLEEALLAAELLANVLAEAL
jgi:stage II sporulation protein P